MTNINNDDITSNLNSAISHWHLSDEIGPYRAIVCLLCDKFILPQKYHILTIEQLTQYQEYFNRNSLNNVSDSLANCYKVNLPSTPRIQNIRNQLQIEDLLLSPRSSYMMLVNDDEGFTICTECINSLIKNKRPKFCIANNYCFGSPPACLTNLTDVELSMITPIKSYGYCFSYTGGQRHQLKGSLTYYRMNKKSIITSIANLEAIDANIVILLHGDLTRKQYEMTKKKNTIRITYLTQAITWLLQNNSEWSNINTTIEDIINNIQNPDIIEDYNLVEDDDIDNETKEHFNVIYPDGNISVNTGGQDSIEILQELVHRANSNNHDIAYQCQLMKECVTDYKDNNLVNACLLQFPYGRGGMHEQRLNDKDEISTVLNIEEYLKNLSMISQPQFHKGLFTLIIYNMIIKQKNG
jgi:hypothetical protein